MALWLLWCCSTSHDIQDVHSKEMEMSFIFWYLGIISASLFAVAFAEIHLRKIKRNLTINHRLFFAIWLVFSIVWALLFAPIALLLIPAYMGVFSLVFRESLNHFRGKEWGYMGAEISPLQSSSWYREMVYLIDREPSRSWYDLFCHVLAHRWAKAKGIPSYVAIRIEATAFVLFSVLYLVICIINHYL